MALVSTGFFCSVTIVDASGVNKSNLQFDIADEADAATIATRLTALTSGLVQSYRVGEKFEEDTLVVGTAGSEIENVALISARIDNPAEKYAQLRIPAPVDGLFNATTGSGRNIVNPAFAALQTYLGSFVTTTGIATLSDGETLLAPATAGNVTGKRIHRASRKG